MPDDETLRFEFRTGTTRHLSATTTENWKRKQAARRATPSAALPPQPKPMTSFRDLFAGRYIILDTDGVPLGDGAVGTGCEPRRATHPSRIRWFDDFDAAKAFRNKYLATGSVHRVERLELLQEKFSY